jgi:hypothetical protein
MTRSRATPALVPLLVLVLPLMAVTMIVMMLIAIMTMLLLMMAAANSIVRGIYERANATSGPMSCSSAACKAAI